MAVLAAAAGCFNPEDSAGIPAGEVTDSFRIDRREVTTAGFARFAARSGWVTDAERIGWSLVFHPQGSAADDARVVPGAPWWVQRDGADWRRPQGADGPPAAGGLPVVQVSWNDAAAFCADAGGRLPTSAEWEHAARGGLEGAVHPWGDGSPFLRPAPANLFDGRFPFAGTARDGYAGPAPPGRFPPNGYGLFDMGGNVWEWVDGGRPGSRPLRGGSFLCAENSCQGYRISWENRAPEDSAWDHTGFRCAWDR